MEVKKDRRGRQTRGTNYITGGIFFNFLLLQSAAASLALLHGEGK